MQIFLSYASQDREAARAIERGLSEQGHKVFFDRDDLPPGEEYHAHIRRAIEAANLLIFLVSPDAVDAGSYTLSEVDIAEKAWKRASGRLLPVVLRPTPKATLPLFVRSVTLLDTPGNVVAAVIEEVHRIGATRRRRRLRQVGVTVALATVILAGAYRYWTGGAPDSETTGRDGAPSVRVDAGAFIMGDDDNSPRREVYLDAYYIDRYEVTTARYARFLEATVSVRPPDGWESLKLPAGGELPVTGVDWRDADAYCGWVGRRLPTESEWEKAARGSDGRMYPWGDASPTIELANYENASPDAYNGGLTEVGKYPAGASPYGVYDLAGNAAEWVADWYSDSFAADDVRNPTGPVQGTERVVRGGGRFDPGYRISPTKRYYATPDQRSDDIGFRCAHNGG